LIPAAQLVAMVAGGAHGGPGLAVSASRFFACHPALQEDDHARHNFAQTLILRKPSSGLEAAVQRVFQHRANTK
jgi:hypothetical protein